MSSRDIYNKATVYNPVDTRTQAPQHSHTSSRPSSSLRTAPSSSRPSSAAPNTYTTLERDNNSSSRASSSRLPQQYTALQRDGQVSSSYGQPSPSHGQSPADRRMTMLNRDQQSSSMGRPTMLNRDHQSSSSSRQPTMMRAAGTNAPPDIQSKFKTQHDVDMASRQVRYQQMNHDEKQRQDKWVHDFIQHAGPCPAGFDWERVRDGYVCNGGNHLCTDELLAEGKGGFYFGTLAMGWWGPVYDSNAIADYKIRKVRIYARTHGLDPRVDSVMPDPDLPATGEVHPGIAKAMAGMGQMPREESNEAVRARFENLGGFQRNYGGANSSQLSSPYGPVGQPNRLAMSMINGSFSSPLSHLSHGWQPPLGFGPSPYGSGLHGSGLHGSGLHGSGLHGSGLHGSGLYGNGPCGQGPQGQRRRRF